MFKNKFITSLFLGLLMAAQPALPATAEQAQAQTSRIAKLLRSKTLFAATGLVLSLGMFFALQRHLDVRHENNCDMYKNNLKKCQHGVDDRADHTERSLFARRSLFIRDSGGAAYVRTGLITDFFLSQAAPSFYARGDSPKIF